MHRPSPVLRIAAAVLAVAWLTMPAPGFAADEAADEDAKEDDEHPPPAPVEGHWYDSLLHNTDVGIDLIVIRPLSAVTLVAGAALFVPAAAITSPNGWDSIKEAYQRFVGEPGEYFYSRPLGEF